MLKPSRCLRQALTQSLTNPMLSHVPNADRALEEIWRVLRPRGRLYVGTSGRNHMREVFDLLKRFDPSVPWGGDETRFEFETAPGYLRPRFQNIELEHFENMLLISEPAPLVDYVYSMSPPFVPAASRKTEFHYFVVREFEERGPMRITKDMGIVAAMRSKPPSRSVPHRALGVFVSLGRGSFSTTRRQVSTALT